MKKLVSIAILFVMVVVLATSMVNAFVVEKANFAEVLTRVEDKYGLSASDKLRIERFVNTYVETDDQASNIYDQVLAAEDVLDAAGIKSIADLEKADSSVRANLASIANKAADEIGVKLAFKNMTVEISKDGKLIEVIGIKDGKLTYTGNDVSAVLVVSSVAVLALATAFVAKRKMANA